MKSVCRAQGVEGGTDTTQGLECSIADRVQAQYWPTLMVFLSPEPTMVLG